MKKVPKGVDVGGTAAGAVRKARGDYLHIHRYISHSRRLEKLNVILALELSESLF